MKSFTKTAQFFTFSIRWIQSAFAIESNVCSFLSQELHWLDALRKKNLAQNSVETNVVFTCLYLTKLHELYFNGSYLYPEQVNTDGSTWCCVPNPLSDQVAEYRKKDDCVQRVRRKVQHQLEEWRRAQLLEYRRTSQRLGKQTTSRDVPTATWHLNAAQGSAETLGSARYSC